jgi:hypothetical protein
VLRSANLPYIKSASLIHTKWLLGLHQRYGRVVRIAPDKVSVAAPEYYRTIYNDARAAHKDPAFYAQATFNDRTNLFQMVGKEQHGARRRLSAQSYSWDSMLRLETLILAKAAALTHRIIARAASPSTDVDAFNLCGLFTFEVICKAAFDKDFAADNVDEGMRLLQAMDGSATTLIVNTVLPWLRGTGLANFIPGPIGAGFRAHQFWLVQSRQILREWLSSQISDDNTIFAPFRKQKDSFLSRCLDEEEMLDEGKCCLGCRMWKRADVFHDRHGSHVRRIWNDVDHTGVSALCNLET